MGVVEVVVEAVAIPGVVGPWGRSYGGQVRFAAFLVWDLQRKLGKTKPKSLDGTGTRVEW
jgi:hypothetical protein